MLSFKELNLISPILQAVNEEGYEHPTLIQERAIPLVLAKKDLLGCAQTGTGKTAAFAIPVIQLLQTQNKASGGRRAIKSLILTPTRELAVQIGESFTSYGKYTDIRHTVVFGGVNQNSQVRALQKGVDIVIATPGRLKDLMNQGYINLNQVELFVLDEADRMLDMGFINDIKLLLSKLPANRQSLFFTATLTPEIKKLASAILVHPETIEVTPVSSAAETVSQSVYHVLKKNKKSLLLHLIEEGGFSDMLVFTRTKHGADRLTKDLSRSGIKADAIHGGKSQNARQRALSDFKSKKIRVLVATDVASRGIDIDKLSYVINYDLPNEPETYIHRIGRTGRAGAAGSALSFCDEEEKMYLKQINKLLLSAISVIEHPFSEAISANRPDGIISAKKQFTGKGNNISKSFRSSNGIKNNRSFSTSI